MRQSNEPKNQKDWTRLDGYEGRRKVKMFGTDKGAATAWRAGVSPLDYYARQTHRYGDQLHNKRLLQRHAAYREMNAARAANFLNPQPEKEIKESGREDVRRKKALLAAMNRQRALSIE